MEKIIFNDDNLEKELVNEITVKVRAILINTDNEILVANYGGIFLFPGGTLEKNENIEMTLIRELEEELGIKITIENRVPDLLIEQLIMNYPKRNNKGMTDRLMSTYYYLIPFNGTLGSKIISLTDNEINDNFTVHMYSISEIRNLVLNNETSNPRDKFFAREINAVLEIIESQKLLGKILRKNK